MKEEYMEAMRELWNYEFFPRIKKEIRKTVEIGETLQAYPSFMTVSQVAKAMKVTPKSVYLWIENEILKAGYTKSNTIRIEKSELLIFIYGRQEK